VDMYGLAVASGALAALVARAPSDEEALRRIDWAAREYGPEATIHPLAALGHAARDRGDYEGAATWYRRSLAVRQEVGDTPGLALALKDFACLAARQEQWERAARLLGAADGACMELERTLPVPVPEGYSRAVEGSRAALGEVAFAAAWAAGRAMSLEDAIQFALAEQEPS
jgi:hypothetical protein